MGTSRRVNGAIALADLVRANPDAVLGEIASLPRVVQLDAELEEVARLMTDYDLTVVGVVDTNQQLQGVVTVDDVLELVLPRGWRRRFTLADE
jgi:Mg/Co/Ni transporter MgtE